MPLSHFTQHTRSIEPTTSAHVLSSGNQATNAIIPAINL